jgi:hypothetical protein
VNRQSPFPSQNRIFSIDAFVPRKANRWILRQRLLHQHGEPVEAFAHIGVAQRQVHLHAWFRSFAPDVLTNCVWIDAGRCQHAPAVRQVDRRHSVRRLHEITQ